MKKGFSPDLYEKLYGLRFIALALLGVILLVACAGVSYLGIRGVQKLAQKPETPSPTQPATGALPEAPELPEKEPIPLNTLGSYTQYLPLVNQNPPAEVVIIPPIPVAESEDIYRVRLGDTLWRIAARLCDNGEQWIFIYQANREKIANPHWIYPGQKLVIPCQR